MSARILVCDDEASLREMLQILLRREGYRVDVVDGVHAARDQLGSCDPYDVVITDLVMPDGTGMDVLDAVRARSANTQTLMVTAFATTEQAVEAMRKGAYDYVQKPFKNHELLATLEKALEKRAIVAENETLRAEVKARWTEGQLIGKSPAMDRLRDLIKRVANATTSVLITGESGTGKEMVARALHFQSPRAEEPFVVLNCGAIPENLIESELFGHVKGAFTGAIAAKQGLFRAANGGTLFLDEVGELPPPLQVKLLRVLQDRKVRPVGGSAEVEVDVRVVAATNRDVESEVDAGTFREDLFYRLNVIRIEVPTLRERPEDIPVLAGYFLQKHMALQGRRLEFSPEAIRWLAQQSYAGNVRELENMVERGVTLAPDNTVNREDLGDTHPSKKALNLSRIPEENFELDDYLTQVERELLLRALDQAGGVRKKAAELLGMSFRQFRYRLAKHIAPEVGDAAND
ncbi:MAG: sigma-54-dependent Fis family transcriptional regulator [Deltaproteobacteria bacterium]|nr:sigma-54-dependent Fis family transcriptional regulator [Deltaproteobacteria bacterium]MBW1876101.1 sigma-54-dependent Fis family transcriptional regulator [Deltaproteobacteria bacterium]MBW2211138.1 sigma-54-dependent Fis family transcriptional regulator [Deltaproteobacteria bacterium]MBW2214449.1 sigma-54-dependent Fis family transcriptional regulator [Deltaproteobacteria bacterium]MBW2380216.1 sigma-54-dependent Fis family transcriptional regulator [Deltaproteobacteria bacterium]